MRGARFLVLFALTMMMLPGVQSQATALRSENIEPGLLQQTGTQSILARFGSVIPGDVTDIDGLEIVYRFTSLPAIHATATQTAIRALAARDDLVYLEADKEITPDLDSATVASRAREVWGTDPVLDANGDVVDGRGVGIAIVDSGLDATHPDFQGAGKVGGNYMVVPGAVVPGGPYTSSRSAHGTHVAGIAAGTGTASDGLFRGVAPGASLYAFNAVSSAVLAATAFDWIATSGADQDPPIKIVNNSWHCSAQACGTPLNSKHLHIALASELAERGITVTWSAGNERGDGDLPTINPEAINPTPGIIGVANYKDTDWPGLPEGTSDGCLSSSSAWGTSGDPTTWPDVSAPGRSVMSTWSAGVYNASDNAGGRNIVTGEQTYRVQSGTSMAAPHVAGLAALMLQVNPALTPAEIEYIVKRAAVPLHGDPAWTGCGIDYVKADPAHPWTGANYAAGHGLIDAVASVTLADGFPGIPEAPPVEPLPEGFVVVTPGFRDTHTLYLWGEDAMTTSYPDATAPRVRVMMPDGTRIVHTSEPFVEAVGFDALKVDLFIGNSSEARELLSVIGTMTIFADVDALAPDGTVTRVASLTRTRESGRSMWPVHRDLLRVYDERQTFQAGDRLRLSIRAIGPAYQGVEPGVNNFWDLYSESYTPSRVSFADEITPPPGSRESCERVRWCAQVDETHPYEGLVCDDVPMLLSWTGPPGSMLVFGCSSATFVCPVVVLPGETEGTCEMEVIQPTPLAADEGAWCWGVLPDGSRGGRGRCISTVPIFD